jgi:hypothetical protein
MFSGTQRRLIICKIKLSNPRGNVAVILGSLTLGWRFATVASLGVFTVCGTMHLFPSCL